MHSLQFPPGKRVYSSTRKMLAFGPFHRLQRHISASRRVTVRRAAQQDDLKCRKLKGRHGLLQEDRTAACQLARGPFSKGFSTEAYHARRGTKLSAKQFQKRGFPSPIGTQHGNDFTRFNGKVDSRYQEISAGTIGQALRFQHQVQSALWRCRSSMKRKNGPPQAAVITPIGSSAGAKTVRAIVSAAVRRIAPSRADPGNSHR